jgi:YceI-like domain
LSKRLGLLGLLILLSSCAHAPHRGAAPTAPVPSTSAENPPALPPPGNYQIDPNQSELRLLVYRAGPLAHLGHNHVMINRAISGQVAVATSLEASSITLSVPVEKFDIDDTHARQEEGADFPGEIPEDHKTGTLHNMLSATQLNSEKFPTLLIQSKGLDNSHGALTATFDVGVAGHVSSVTAPFVLSTQPGQLTASATFELRQTALGLTPYSLMGGSLAVKDALTVKIRIVAKAQ